MRLPNHRICLSESFLNMSVGRHGNRTRLEIGAWRPPRLLVYDQFQLISPKNIEQYPRLLPFVPGCSSRCSTYYTRPTPRGCYMLLHLLGRIKIYCWLSFSKSLKFFQLTIAQGPDHPLAQSLIFTANHLLWLFFYQMFWGWSFRYQTKCSHVDVTFTCNNNLFQLIIATGGWDGDNPLSSCELFDPSK